MEETDEDTPQKRDTLNKTLDQAVGCNELLCRLSADPTTTLLAWLRLPFHL
jgi:hypothetical protein